jgi:hypothetical protein
VRLGGATRPISVNALEFDSTGRLFAAGGNSLYEVDPTSGEAHLVPKSPMAEALGYSSNNWVALVRYTESGFLANVAEREMKRIAIGRKNWLTVGSPRGGQTTAVLFSFTSTCQRLGVEPWAYLQDMLTRLPATSGGQLTPLLPDQWQAARPIRTTLSAMPPIAPTRPAGESAS